MKKPKSNLPKNLTGKTLNGVRPNQRHKFVKATNQQIEEIVDFVANLLARQATKLEVHAAVRERYHKDWSTCDQIYIPRAKKLLSLRASINAGEARETGINILLGILKTGNSRERIAAERRLSEIYGYDAARQYQISTPPGQAIVTQEIGDVKPLSKNRLREILAVIGDTDDKAEVQE